MISLVIILSSQLSTNTIKELFNIINLFQVNFEFKNMTAEISEKCIAITRQLATNDANWEKM